MTIKHVVKSTNAKTVINKVDTCLLANTYVLGIIDGTYVGMCEDTGTI